MKSPKHLSIDTAVWWESVANEYALEPHHVRLLTLACEAWDRCQQAREILDREGLTFTDRFNCPKTRPEVAVERDNRIAFARLVRELDLDIDGPPEAPRAPALRSNRGGSSHAS